MNEKSFLNDLSECLMILPGVGQKTANRYAYALLEDSSAEDVEKLAKVLIDTKKRIKNCDICGMLTLDNVCVFCQSSLRDKSKIMVVKNTKDVMAVEKTKSFNGLYHCLNGLISPVDGVGPNDLNVDSLLSRLENGVQEIILATPFTPQGETTALYLEKLISKYNVKITSIGYGLPAGGDIEFVDELTLKKAMDNRK